MVDLSIASPDAEKFLEVENGTAHIFCPVAADFCGKVIDEHCKTRQIFVWISITSMFNRPIRLGSLLHHIVPGRYATVTIGIKDIEWCAREGEKLLSLFIVEERLYNFVAKRSLRSFVRFIHNYTVPMRSENIYVLVKITTNDFRTTQVLYGREIDKVFSAALAEFVHCRTVILLNTGLTGTVNPRSRVLRPYKHHVAEVLEPTIIHYGPMRNDNRFLEPHSTNEFQRSHRLPEAHLGVPEILGRFL